MGAATSQPNDAAATGIMRRPPLLFLACLLLGLALDRELPPPLDLPGTTAIRRMAGAGLIVIGLAIAAAGLRNFSRAGTPFRSDQPVRALVTDGVHGLSRSPIYVGMSLTYAGIGTAARSPWIFILALPLAIMLNYVVVRARGGVPRAVLRYRAYKAYVRRRL